MEYTLSSTSINASLDSLHFPTKKKLFRSKEKIPSSLSFRGEKHPPHPRRRTVDRGYSYVVLVAVTLAFFSLCAVFSTNALIYQQLLVIFGLNATATGWMISLQGVIRLAFSPFVRLFYDRFEYRTVAILGGLFYTLGVLFSAYASQPWVVYASFGVLAGIGSCMFLLSSFIILADYFDAMRGRAMGIAYAGTSVAGIIFPPIISACFEQFGYLQTMMICACIVAQLCVTGALYRPQPPQLPLSTIDEKLTPESTTDDKTCCSDLKLLINGQYIGYILIMGSQLGLNFTGNVYVTSLGEEIAGLSRQQNALVLSISSIGQLCAQFCSGFLFDIRSIRQYRTYLFSVISGLFGVSCLSLAFCTDFLSFTVMFTIFQLLSLGAHCQHVTILGDILPPSDLPGGIALCRLPMGLGFFGFSTLAGTFSDVYGSKALAFVCLGVFHTMLTLLCTLLYSCLNRKAAARKRGLQTGWPA